jgi:hypothetical protein
MKNANFLATIILACAVTAVFAQDDNAVEPRSYFTKRVVEAPPVIDGRLDDRTWGVVDWTGDFIQRDPTEGEPPSQQTKFKIVYDDEAIYFAFRSYDDPEQVSKLLARRDWFPGDWVEVNIDSYHDKRTAFSFTLSLSGTRGDEFISSDGNSWDGNWDPVWQGATNVDNEGWTAEMRIPLSQLRFSNEENQTWGLQVQRRIFREEERSTWQPISKDVSGWVSRFGQIRGITGIRPGRNVELLPYALTKGETFEKIPGDPYVDGSAGQITGGLDGKIGVTNNLTVDFTVNPDFGQVEADPSEVNLSAFETFFSEKRPFFIEGSNIFDLRIAPAITGGSFTSDNLFYSRRIGGSPHHWPDIADDEYLDQPTHASILGAFKLTGKTKNGLSIGILESLTAKEEAEIDNNGARRKETVEPMTNYLVGRLQQDFREGETQLGVISTAVNRNIDEDQLGFMREQAYAGGVDFSHYMKDHSYQLEANVMGSTLRGSQLAIEEAQLSSARYYQRPDNDYTTLDTTRTSLSGHAGSVRFRRTSNSNFVFQTGAAWRSPGFEINDLGFMRSADGINQFTWAAYQIRNPLSIFDRFNLNTNQWLNWDYGGNFLSAAANTNFNATFRNKYSVGGGFTRSGESTSNTALRGGPSSKWPGESEYSFWVNSDGRKKVRLNFGGYLSKGDDASGTYKEAWASVTVRPADALQISFNPSASSNWDEMQYVGTEAFAGDDRYLFAKLHQRTVNFTFRVDYCLSPALTVQYYGSPFVSAGKYNSFKRITNARAESYRDRFSTFGAGQITYDAVDEEYAIDENRDATNDYYVDNPNFNVGDFNSNLVVRWEYMPGSLLYVVWSQARSNFSPVGPFELDQNLDSLFDQHPHDVFLIKFVKWFSV